MKAHDPDKAFRTLLADFEKVVDKTPSNELEARVVRAADFLKKCRDDDKLEELRTLFSSFLGLMFTDDTEPSCASPS